jgi:hypothetical protein
MPDHYVNDSVMDVALADIANNGNALHLISQEPTSYADVLTYSLGFVALTVGDGNGDYTIQNGVVSGRRLSLAQQTVPGTAEGVATHAAIIDTVAEVIKQFTTAPSYNMANAVNQSVPGYDVWEIKDPT